MTQCVCISDSYYAGKSSSKCDVTVWSLSVCAVFLFYLNRVRDTLVSNLNRVRSTYSMQLSRGQHSTRPAYISILNITRTGITCYVLLMCVCVAAAAWFSVHL